jgi:hypothetical protein
VNDNGFLIVYSGAVALGSGIPAVEKCGRKNHYGRFGLEI